MQGRRNTPFVITLLMVLLGITLFTQSPQLQGAHLMSACSAKLACHFFHANLFHWFCNAMALWLMRPSPKDMLLAFPMAVIAMFFTTTPTIGISAMIYAYIGVNIIRWKVSLVDWGTFIVANLITIFIPNVAFGVHLAAFMMGLFTYITHRQINSILLRVEEK
jgi:hypothetical protein